MSRVWLLFMAVFFTAMFTMPEFLATGVGASKNIVSVFVVGLLLAVTGGALFVRRRMEVCSDLLFSPALVWSFAVLVTLGVVQFAHGFTRVSFSGFAFEAGTFVSFVVAFSAFFFAFVLTKMSGQTFALPTLFALGFAGVLTVSISLGGGASFGAKETAEYRTTTSSALHATFSAYGDSLKTVLIGNGLDSYTDTWALYRPTGLNATGAWDQDPVRARGLVFTLAVTAGSLLLILYALALASILVVAVRCKTVSERPFAVVLAGACALILLSCLVYTPHLGFFVIFGVMAGTLFAISDNNDTSRRISPSFRASICAFVAVVTLCTGVVLGAISAQRALAIFTYTEALTLQGAGAEISEVLGVVERSVRFAPTLPAIHLGHELHYGEAARFLQKEIVTEDDRRRAQEHLDQANRYVQRARALGSTGYRSLLKIANIEVSLGLMLSDREHIEAGIENYRAAQALAPTHPSAFFLEAQTLSLLDEVSAARTVLQTALHLKPDYLGGQELMDRLSLETTL